MLVAGDEFARTQHGNNNAYCQDSEIGWINWDLDEDGKALLKFVKRLIKLRLAYPIPSVADASWWATTTKTSV